MESVLYSLAVVLIFGAIIVFHEAGHFLIAKLSRIPVHEFAVGLGPVLFSLRRRETQYSLRAIPVGGMVRVAGMEPGEEVAEGFNKKPRGIRVGVITAGPMMNIVLAAVIFCLNYTVFGVPVRVTSEVAKVMRGKPAARAGIRPGDRLISVNQVASRKPDKLREEIVRNPGRPVEIVVERGGERLHLRLVPERKPVTEKVEFSRAGKLVRIRKVKQWVGQIGIVFQDERKRLSLLEALAAGLGDTWEALLRIAEGLILVVRGRAPLEFTGPVGIVGIMYEQAQVSWLSFLGFAGILSLLVAFFNLLPFPALDGSRIMFLGIERALGRRIDPRKEALVHTVGLVLLLLFVLVVTVGDIWKRWGPQ